MAFGISAIFRGGKESKFFFYEYSYLSGLLTKGEKERLQPPVQFLSIMLIDYIKIVLIFALNCKPNYLIIKYTTL